MLRVPATLALLTILGLPCPTARALEAPSPDLGATIVGSVHDFSAQGPSGRTLGAGAERVCSYCHVGHDVPAQPAWNPATTTRAFRMYSAANSSTFVLAHGEDNTPSRPVGEASLVCLSCHDGTIASNAPNQAPLRGNSRSPLATTGLGTDLTNDHPISFTYDRALFLLKGGNRPGGLRDPDTTLAVTRRSLAIQREDEMGADTVATQMLYPRRGSHLRDQVECVSCHDPHLQGDPADPAGTYPFLVMTNQRSRLCFTCHNK